MSDKQCPRCRLINPPSAMRCDCGYDFHSKQLEQSYLHPSTRSGTGSSLADPDSQLRWIIHGFFGLVLLGWPIALMGAVWGVFSLPPSAHRFIDALWFLFYGYPFIYLASILIAKRLELRGAGAGPVVMAALIPMLTPVPYVLLMIIWAFVAH